MTHRRRPSARRTRHSTIRDVAARAGVSTATVSRVLNEHPNVTGVSRRRVTQAIQALGYTPNAIARSLRARRTRTVGLLLRDAANTNFSIVTKAAQAVAGHHGYNVLVGSSEGDPAKERRFIDLLVERQVDGLVIYASDEAENTLGAVVRRQVPVVLVESRVSGLDVDRVVCDNAGGAGDAVEHLLGLGHRRIEIFTGSPRRTPGRERLRGYMEAFARRGLRPDPGWIHAVSALDADARRRLATRLSGARPPTAIFAATAHLTLDVLGVIREAGRTVARDVSVVGFDNRELAELMTPRLTTVERDLHRIGAEAIGLLLSRLGAGAEAPPGPRQVVIPTTLVVRESCRAVAGRNGDRRA